MSDFSSEWHWRLAVKFEGFARDAQAEVLSVLNRDLTPHRFLPMEMVGNAHTTVSITKGEALRPYGPGNEPPRDPPEVFPIAFAGRRGPGLPIDDQRLSSELLRIQNEVQKAVNSWWYGHVAAS